MARVHLLRKLSGTERNIRTELNLFGSQATVMLTSNVGYLAIQSVDIDMGADRSPGQIASYLSVVANIGSIILGLLLMRQNRTKRSETADEVVSRSVSRLSTFY